MYINEIEMPDLGVDEDFPFSVTMTGLPSLGNELVSADRFVYGVDSNPVDVKELVDIMDTNRVIFETFWKDTETPTAGKYRLRVRAKTTETGTPKETANLIFRII